ncbi:Bacterial type II and III secretion system protein [Phycisphaerae bacterium RAS2]|nr:Bacterial type II and III secretion system protein [Phycisphaerae bacterium RAS2]
MFKLRTWSMVLGVVLLAAVSVARADDEPSASERLTAAIKLVEAGDYAAGKDALLEISEDELDDDEQINLQRFLGMAERALADRAKAREDLAAGEKAMKAGKTDDARKAFEAVVACKVAEADVVSKARTHLTELDKSQKSAGEAAASAKSNAAMGDAPRPAAPKSGGGLVDELAEEHALLWQQAVKTYKETEAKLRQALLAEDFAEARRLLDFARQTIELNRRYASPAALYEDYRKQANELERFLEGEQQDYDEQLVRMKQEEVAARERERVEQVRIQKTRQIEQLMDQAAELRKEQRLDDAIQVLKQVLAIDPNNEQAAWMKETLEDLAINRRNVGATIDKQNEAQDLLVANEETAIPWHRDIMYPKNWREISAKRTGAEEAAEPESNRVVRRKLESVAPEIKYDAVPFRKVIEQLRDRTGLNIVPNWTALDSAGIDPETEVSLRLSSVKFSKAMQLILDAVGAGDVQLAYEVDDGVIAISTKEDLARKTLTRVYGVQDLIISVPTFRGRQINLDQIGQNSNQQGGLGGGRFLGGAGGGGGGGAGGGNIFGGGGGGQQDDDLQNTQEDPILPIIELIRQTIDPESWREAGGNTGSIQALNQQLVVTQTSSAHTQLRDLLRQLRQSRALQIAVEARYITITRNWLEQIGVDLDVVLNNGNAGFDRTTILDPATNNPVLVPRQFVRNGFTPGAPANVGIGLPTQPFGQPYGQPGLVPASGNVGPAIGTMTPIPIVNNTLDLAAPSNTNINGTLGSIANTTPAFQIFGSFLDNIQVDFLLRATQIDRRSSDLDAPRLVLFNGQRAAFEAFIEQDYIAALTPVIGDNAGAFLPNIATALTGRSLDVQATVTADRRYVTMTVRTFTRVTGDFRTVFFGGSQTVGSGFIELATQTTQQVRTTVSVPDGGTLLIGGLKLSAERDIDAGVPILSRIPVLKRAFSNTSNVKDDQVLLILIKPTIIIQEEAEAEAFPTLTSATGL